MRGSSFDFFAGVRLASGVWVTVAISGLIILSSFCVLRLGEGSFVLFAVGESG